MPEKKSRIPNSKKKSTSSSRRSASTRTRKSSRQPTQQTSLLGNLTPERKIDLVGVVIALVGLLSIISLFSFHRSGLTGSWLDSLALIFGWGVYIFPFGLFILGIWLIARNVENLPKLSFERGVGILLLFLNILVIMHASAGPFTDAMITAEVRQGGGYLGGLILQILFQTLGSAGTIIVVMAWFIIAMMLTLDLSVQELFKWTGPIAERVRILLEERMSRQSSNDSNPRNEGGVSLPGSESTQNGYTPLQRPPVGSQKSAAITGSAFKPGASSKTAITWTLPSTKDILEMGSTPAINEEFIKTRARLIEETLASFGAPSQVVEISRGPTITMFGVEPNFVETRYGRTRVRVNKIVSLADDLALALAAPRIRIQAPVPGRSYVGIEVPNEEMTLVTLREVIESEVFLRHRSPLRIALGKDVSGHPQTTNLSTMPHLLIAGTTGSGKSVCVNGILSCLLLHNTPDTLRLILVDPKRVELTGYNNIPHLLSPVVVEMERVIGALQWMMREMDNRYHKFAQSGARNIQDFNQRMRAQDSKGLPYLVVVIDELADLMMIAPDETERTITRIAQLARATGIHLIIATQRPSVDVVTGLIKANFPARIAFAVASNVDSRVILDQPGAERLLGRGDMLFQAPDAAAPVRLQGVFVSDMEIQRLVDFWRQQAGQSSVYAVPAGNAYPGAAHSEPGGTSMISTDGFEKTESGIPLKQVPMFEDMTPEEKVDPLLDEAVGLVKREGRASISMLQRKLRIGYTRAARIVDVMQDKGIISPPQGGTGVRSILDESSEEPTPKE